MGFSSMIKKRYFIILSLLVCMTIPFAWNFLKPYQRDRLTVFVNPNVDPLGAGYTIIQSKVAIGSGGIAGKGFLSGTQNQFNFLPERHSDFIFTVVAEEWGFLGSLFLLFIYWIILSKILDKSKELKDNYARYLLMGIAAMIFIHVFVNIGMTLGILPVVGIPLSFISYGGTNLLMTMILIGLFLGACRE
jgi:rod shape determining protein RodA